MYMLTALVCPRRCALSSAFQIRTCIKRLMLLNQGKSSGHKAKKKKSKYRLIFALKTQHSQHAHKPFYLKLKIASYK